MGAITSTHIATSVMNVLFFMFLMSKNCINLASLEYFYMMHILMYYGNIFNNLDYI
jgi:hypothetical protein